MPSDDTPDLDELRARAEKAEARVKGLEALLEAKIRDLLAQEDMR